ncbi:MAG: YdiU family protein [Pseudomonadota bacterium]
MAKSSSGQPLFVFDNSYARLPDRFAARLNPQPVKTPGWIAFNKGLAEALALDARALKTPEGLEVFAGNTVPDGANPLAMIYAGQQFGHWNPQLGDGRALLLGEVVDQQGTRFDVQLKGSGPTPFSRMGDGRAWLGPVMREYLVSEAMYALGIPTTRALAAVSTGETIIREAPLPGAVLTRVSRGHIRVGTFQYFASQQDDEALRLLTDHCLHRFYPDRAEAEWPGAALFEAVVEAQATLIARWMAVGFIHGVMNTDNVSIAGETIDYGPCAFMDEYQPDKVFSSIDEMGRYAYSNQPRIGHWNLVQLAQALLPLMGADEESAVAAAQAAVDRYPDISQSSMRGLFADKLGLGTVNADTSKALADDLLALMAEHKADFTNTFRALSNDDHAFLSAVSEESAVQEWLARWHEALAMAEQDVADVREAMRRVNPKYIPRNHRIEEAIRAGIVGDFAPFERLHTLLKTPFDEQPDHDDLSQTPQESERVRYTFCGT